MPIDLKNFTKNYLRDLNNILSKIDLDELEKFKDLLLTTKGRIYIIGNGGSASTSSHMANDLAVGLKRRGIHSFNVISLNDNSAVTSAIGNDIGFDNIFYMQLKDILTSNDTVIAISCSGNSPNIVKAINYAKEVKANIVGLTGFDGGELKELSDIKLHIETQKGAYGLVEDAHLIINHILFSYFLEANNE